MELPKKLEAPEYCTWSKESPEAKINELIDYLESQKEGEDDCLCHLGEPPKKGCINYKEEPKCSCAIDNVGGNCKWCKEEPKQVDVDVMLFEYATLHAQPNWTHEDYKKMQEIINTLKQALQQ